MWTGYGGDWPQRREVRREALRWDTHRMVRQCALHAYSLDEES
jgi:hypothetical protein